MAVDIHCRMLGIALCWNGSCDWLLYRFDVTPYEDRDRSLLLQSAGKEQSDSDHKEHRTLQSDSDHREHWTLHSDSEHKEHWTLRSDSDHTEHRTLQSDSDHKEHRILQSDSDHKEHWTLLSDSDQHDTQQAMLSVCILKVSVLWTAELPVRILSKVRL